MQEVNDLFLELEDAIVNMAAEYDKATLEYEPYDRRFPINHREVAQHYLKAGIILGYLKAVYKVEC